MVRSLMRVLSIALTLSLASSAFAAEGLVKKLFTEEARVSNANHAQVFKELSALSIFGAHRDQTSFDLEMKRTLSYIAKEMFARQQNGWETTERILKSMQLYWYTQDNGRFHASLKRLRTTETDSYRDGGNRWFKGETPLAKVLASAKDQGLVEKFKEALRAISRPAQASSASAQPAKKAAEVVAVASAAAPAPAPAKAVQKAVPAPAAPHRVVKLTNTNTASAYRSIAARKAAIDGRQIGESRRLQAEVDASLAELNSLVAQLRELAKKDEASDLTNGLDPFVTKYVAAKDKFNSLNSELQKIALGNIDAQELAKMEKQHATAVFNAIGAIFHLDAGEDDVVDAVATFLKISAKINETLKDKSGAETFAADEEIAIALMDASFLIRLSDISAHALTAAAADKDVFNGVQFFLNVINAYYETTSNLRALPIPVQKLKSTATAYATKAFSTVTEAERCEGIRLMGWNGVGCVVASDDINTLFEKRINKFEEGSRAALVKAGSEATTTITFDRSRVAKSAEKAVKSANIEELRAGIKSTLTAMLKT